MSSVTSAAPVFAQEGVESTQISGSQAQRGRRHNQGRGNGQNHDTAHTHGHGGQDSSVDIPLPVNGITTRGGRGRGGSRQLRGTALAFRPASVAPAEAVATNSTVTSSTQQSEGEGVNYASAHVRSRRGGRGRRNQTSVVETRKFGGSLTNGQQTTSQQAATVLEPSAAEFTPGQKYFTPRATSPTPSFAGSATSTGPKKRKQQKRRMSKSMAPDLPTRIHEDIETVNYECAICTSEILRKSKVWSCHMCWTVFHLDCIKKWSNNSDASSAQQNGDSASRQWRCPGCNLPQEEKPRSYLCWCGKEPEPRSISGLPPHSCGQTCAKPRMLPKQCPHPCELLCHAGPCPPCTHQGTTQRCFCGKQSTTRRCADTNYEGGWSCGEICGDLLPCGEHECERECHEGLCGACEVRLPARCYCGKEDKSILCCDKDDEKSCKRIHLDENGQNIEEDWTGIFRCTNVCDRFFDCGKHSCQKDCHPSDRGVSHCPRSPDMVAKCPCGKTPLASITKEARLSCEDPIPNCSKICSGPLDCGHSCQQKCHIGDCSPCTERIEIKCRCGRTSSSSICHQGYSEAPQCPRICRATLNCGRHECGERCCIGEKRAAERHAQKRKQRPLNAPRIVDEGFEAEHICTRACGRLLKCGKHTCEELCHKGPCNSCPEAIFDEISCNCGRTTLHPPLPCGTKSPVCRYDCERPKACGHPKVQHNCHSNDESCPKCPFLTEKICLCGKRTLKNQQCWFGDVRCGEVCGRILRCGSHVCLKSCHKPGECEGQVQGTCTQACGKAKKTCGHPCDEPCHAPYSCKEEKQCEHAIFITCACQHLKKKARCNASVNSLGNTKSLIDCNDDCLRVERNRKLAIALDIDPATHTDSNIPYSQATLSSFDNLPSQFTTDVERQFRVFATSEDEKRLRFKPMPPHQRTFIHGLAEDYGLDSESLDPSPHRHVLLFKSPRFVSAPSKTLRDCARIRRAQAADNAVQRKEQKERERRSNVVDDWNGYLLLNSRFGLTLSELDSEIRTALPDLNLSISFLPQGDVALKAAEAIPTNTLRTALPALTRTRMGTPVLARFDASYNVLAKEEQGGGGWSQVVAKAAATRKIVQTVERERGQGVFTVLGNLAARKREEKEREEKEREERERRRRADVVLEDWADGVVEEEAQEGVEMVGAEERVSDEMFDANKVDQGMQGANESAEIRPMGDNTKKGIRKEDDPAMKSD